MKLTEGAAAEGDFVLEAAGPSDRLPFRAGEDGPHFLWVYQELFTRLGVRLPFSDFQREVMTRCWVAVSQLHLNSWGLLRTFEKGCKLFGIFEESIQEFKWHYFKVQPAPSRRAFWLDDGGRPFPWVYWNREVKDFVIHELDPLETAVFEFLVSLPAGLPKRNNLTCRWILDNNDAVVGKYLGTILIPIWLHLLIYPLRLLSYLCSFICFANDLLLVEMKKTKLDRMMEMMVDPTRMAHWSVLPTGVPAATAAAAAAASAAPAGSSANPATPSVHVPPPPPATSKAKKSSSKRERPEGVDVGVEEAAKEDPDADLKQKRHRKEKGKEEDLVDRVLGDNAAWEHAVNPLDLAFPKKFNYRKALDAGLTSSSMRKHLRGMLPDHLLGESWRLQCQALACPQLGLEAALKAKTKTEEELLAVKDQLSVLKVERDSALEHLPLKEKADSLAQQLSQKEVEHKSALERVAQLDEDIKVLKAQLESAQLSVSKDQKRAEAAESSVKSLTVSLETAQAELAKSREEANYWCTEWKSLGIEMKEMCQETLEIVLDQEFLGDDVEAVKIPPEVVEKLQQQQPEQGSASGTGGGECPS
ncbi:hypothetical protein PIB30_037215 [Stylosanthes scabra]|uniref:Uncharacterized protein n=1 Tax=Stylosanthes scabra TaxID=79078 RepID=A0ABU6ZAK6_9FABA|nr:hypothetical protein [Stylosanthes scabra]